MAFILAAAISYDITDQLINDSPETVYGKTREICKSLVQKGFSFLGENFRDIIPNNVAMHSQALSVGNEEGVSNDLTAEEDNYEYVAFKTRINEKVEGDPVEEGMACLVCYEHLPSVILFPCKHLKVCKSCFVELGNVCPYCKSHVASHMEVEYE